MACAPTGSGKTLAFALPMLQKMQVMRGSSVGSGFQGLVISPTRELALQVHTVCGL